MTASPTPTPAQPGTLEAAIAGVLAGHTQSFHAFQTRVVISCACGDLLIPAYSSGVAGPDEHRAHVAAVLADTVREWETGRVEAALRNAADDIHGIELTLDAAEDSILDAEGQPFRFTPTERRRIAIQDWLNDRAAALHDPVLVASDALANCESTTSPEENQ